MLEVLKAAPLEQPSPPNPAQPCPVAAAAFARFRVRGLAVLGACGACLSLLLLSACTTAPGSSAVTSVRKLPPALKMNLDAGRTQLLFVMVQLESGEEFPFVLDTGTPATYFDQSLEPKLGKRVLTESQTSWGVKTDVGVYAAPKLYLGGVRLQKSGTNVGTLNLKSGFAALGRPVMGILGMDVLQHYCLQLDFAAHKLRFLPSAHGNPKAWGKPLALTADTQQCFYLPENLVGNKASDSLSMIDTGFRGDGWLTAALFEQWTNHALVSAAGQVRSPEGVLCGASYSDLQLLRNEEPFNGIGLYVLSRHLVTLDFPSRTMYLKRTSVGPLCLEPKEAKAAGRSVFVALKSLKQKGRLPGWAKAEKMPRHGTFYSGSGTIALRKAGDASVYYYQGAWAAGDPPWKLQKAWRTDATGRLLEEYPVE